MRIEVHHDWAHDPVVIDTEEGMVSLRVDDGDDDSVSACITITPQEARAIAGVLLVMAQEAER